MSDQVTKDALDLYMGGQPHRAFALLKEHKHMALSDARELMKEMAESATRPDIPAPVGLDEDVDKAMTFVDTFDEVTATMLRHMRETKQCIALEPMPAKDTLTLSKAIYDALHHMIAHDVNPTRAMLAYIAKIDRNRPNEADIKVMEEVNAHRLRDDLLNLL